MRPLVVLLTVLLGSSPALAGSFFFPSANTSFFADTVVHPEVYASGMGGVLQFRGCIDQTNPFALVMALPTENAFTTWNALVPTTVPNIVADLPDPAAFDYESVLLHELGHALGLAHPHVGIGFYSRSRVGADMVFTLNPGPDGVQGSSDDMRGDDPSLVWFLETTNDPFAFNPTIDFTVYTRDEAMVPDGHSYPANGNRWVAGLILGAPTTQNVLVQGIQIQERVRELTMDDVALLALGEHGLDRVVSADDYLVELVLSAEPDCDFMLTFGDAGGGLAQIQFNGEVVQIAGRHYYRDVAQIVFDDQSPWFFQPTIFADGFETGDTSGWDDTFPALVDPVEK